MGTDISGWVEVRYSDDVQEEPELASWYGVIDIGFYVQGRHYDMFALLLGVRNGKKFIPVAAGRGMPLDASVSVKTDIGCGGWHDPSWANWREISLSDWKDIAGDDEWGDEWRLVFHNMSWLANKFSDEYVRLVVYFNS